MPYIGNNHIAGDHTNNFKVLDDISSYTATFNGSASSVVDTTNNTIRVVEHRFIQGQRVTYTNGGGGNIGGLTTGTAYFIIHDSASTFKLATSASNAATSTAINLSAVGTGSSHTLNAAFDGVNTKFKITYNDGTGARFNNATQLNIAINNVLQKPNVSSITFTEGFAIEDNHKIVFKTAPTSEDIFWGSIIANTLTTFDISDHKIDTFTGDGSTTEFTLSHTPANNESLMVTINGVLQHPSNASTARAYSLIASIIQFTAAPGVGDEIQVRHLGFAGATTADVSGFYGRTGNVVLGSTDHITTGDITARNINASGILTASSASFGGNVSIGGTLTYEDVTNIDSVGIITARNGIDCNADLDVDGHTNLDNLSVGGATTITAHNNAMPFKIATSKSSGGIGTYLFSNSVGRFDFKFENTYNGNWYTGSTFHTRILWTAPNEFPTHPEVCSIFPNTALAGAGGDLYALQFNVTDNTSGLKRAYEMSHNKHVFLLNGNVTGLEVNSTLGVGVSSYVYHGYTGGQGDTNTRFGFPSNHNIVFDTDGIERLRINNSSSTFAHNIIASADLDVDGHTNLDNVSISGISTATGGSVFGLIQAGVGALNATIQKTDNGELNLQYNKPGDLHLCQGGGQVRVHNNFNVSGLSTMTGGARLGQLMVGYGAYNITVQPSSGNNTLHFNYDNGTEVRIGEGQTRSDLIVKGDIEPRTDSAFDLGTNTVRWRNVYADTLYGDGSNLTGITQTTINNNADNRIITGSGTANTLNGEANLTWDGNKIHATATGEIARFQSTNSVSTIRLYSTASSHTEIGHTEDTYIAVGGSERIRIKGSNGKVGIHTDTPGRMMHIFSGSTGHPLILERGDNSNTQIEVRSGGAIRGLWGASSTANFMVYDNDASDIQFVVNQTGDVGIGDASPPNFTGYRSLSIHGSTGGALVFGDDGTDEWEIYGGDGILKVYDRANTSERLRINSSGEVGINVSPLRKLHVKSGSNSNDGAFRVESAPGNIMDMGTDGSMHFLNCVNNDPFRIKFAGNEALRLTHETSGNGSTTLQFYMVTNNSQGATPYIKGVCGTEAGGADTNNDGGFEFHTKTGGSGTDINAMKIDANGRVSIGAHNTQNPTAALHIIADTQGTNTALQVGQDSSQRYFRVNEIPNQANFLECLLSYYDNTLAHVLKLQNTFAGSPNFGTAIQFIGHGGTQTGRIAVKNRDANSASNSIMELSASYVTKPSHPCFDANRTAGAVSSTSVIAFNVATTNNGNHYDTSNGRFTAPVDGHYQFWFGAIKQDTVDVVRLHMRKNGSTSNMNDGRQLRLDSHGGGDGKYGENGAVTLIASLNANDYVQVVVTAGTVYGSGSDYTYFCGTLIG